MVAGDEEVDEVKVRQQRKEPDDEEVREGIKVFADWPTIPQLYIKGEFVGGSDIVSEIFENGELETMLREAGALDA